MIAETFRRLFAASFSSCTYALTLSVVSAVAAIGTLTSPAVAVTIASNQTGTFPPELGTNGFGLQLDIASPDGRIEIIDKDGGSSTVATHTISISPITFQYELDLSYRSTNGLVDIESLFPGLELTGDLGEGPNAGSARWISQHTDIGNGKIIWSFEDGPVITVDTNASRIEVMMRDEIFATNAPPLLLDIPETIEISNFTPGNVEANSFAVPEPSGVAIAVTALALLAIGGRRRLGSLFKRR